METKAMSRTQALSFFKLHGEDLKSFAAELKKLSDQEKDELAAMVAAAHGATIIKS